MSSFERQSGGNRVCLLLGSGVTGLPTVSDITEAVTNDEAGQPTNVEARFLRLLKQEIDVIFARMFDDQRQANYEDLAYVANQIGSDFWEYENPATVDFADRIVRDERFLALDHDVGRLANDAVRFIVRTVQLRLEGAASSADCSVLQALVDAARDPTVGSLDIVSLNHDRLVERLFRENQVPFEDGLSIQDGQVSWWSLSKLEESRERVQLLKLHGSIDWWQFSRSVCKAEPDPYNPYHLKNGHGRRIGDFGEGPVILVGTFNKMLRQAGEGIFLDLLGLFSRRIRESDHLIISGYGFGDKGINSVLGAWLEDRRGKAVWIHPRPAKALDTARGAMSGEGCLGRAIARGDMAVVTSRFADVTWEEIRSNLRLTAFERHGMTINPYSLQVENQVIPRPSSRPFQSENAPD